MESRRGTVPQAFFWRRLHSIAGIMLVIFIIEHLLTNSQAALWLGEDGQGFVEMVNSIHSLPYLQAIELLFIGAPIVVHAAYGVMILRTSKSNSWPSDGASPSLSYGRNHAYTWQRITSWVLLVGILVHVIQMRFVEYPPSAMLHNKTTYFAGLTFDPGLYTLADRLHVELYSQERILQVKQQLQQFPEGEDSWVSLSGEDLAAFFEALMPTAKGTYDPQEDAKLSAGQRTQEARKWVATLEEMLDERENTVAVCSDIGTAFLLIIRDTFKSPFIAGLYTMFVLGAAFHAFNGLWTFMITWGVTLTARSQYLSRCLSMGLVGLFAFLGLAAIWGTYWLNLKS